MPFGVRAWLSVTLFQHLCISAPILYVILNISKYSMMTKCHQLDSSKAMSELQESVKKKYLNPISWSSQTRVRADILKQTHTFAGTRTTFGAIVLYVICVILC